MDLKTSIKEKLNSIFCDINKKDKKYSEVWLSDMEFGDLYKPANKFILNVKAEHIIDGCKDEIDFILDLLDEKAKEELQSILLIRVFDTSDEIHCASDEILIYSEEESCKYVSS